MRSTETAISRVRMATASTNRGCWSPPPVPVATAPTRIYRAADSRNPLYTTNVATTCGKCHRFIAERLKASVHGRGTGPGEMAERPAPGGKSRQRPSCTSCHQGHEIRMAASARFRQELPNLCGNCHADLSSRYAMSIHGELTELGYQPAANCFDCHGSHSIQAVTESGVERRRRQPAGDLPEVPPRCHCQLRPIRPARQLQRSEGQRRRLLGVPGAADAAVGDVRFLRAARRVLVRARHCRGVPRGAAERAGARQEGLRAVRAHAPAGARRLAAVVPRAGVDRLAAEVQRPPMGAVVGPPPGRIRLDEFLAPRVRPGDVHVFRDLHGSAGAAISRRPPRRNALAAGDFRARLAGAELARREGLLQDAPLVRGPGAEADLRALGLLGEVRFLGRLRRHRHHRLAPA